MTNEDARALGARCDLCPLKGRPVVPPSPAARGARFVILGEAPGRMEVARMTPFIGPSGKLLDQLLREAGLNRHQAHVTNAMLCRPDDDREDVKLAATSCCAPRLARELKELSIQKVKLQDHKTKPMLALGAVAVRASLGVRGIMKARGFVWGAPEVTQKKIDEAGRLLKKMIVNKNDKTRIAKRRHANLLLEARSHYHGWTIIPSIHPAHILRGADGLLPVLGGDIKRFARLLNGKLVLEDEVEYQVASTPAQIRDLVGKMIGIPGAPGDALAVDIETAPRDEDRGRRDGPDPRRDIFKCVGISNGKDTVVIWPWKKSLAPALRSVLEHRTAVFHFGAQFDQLVLQREGAWQA